MEKSRQNQTNQHLSQPVPGLPGRFMQIPNKLVKDLPTGRLIPLDFVVYGLLGAFACGKGECFPRQTLLAQYVGCDRQTIRRSLKRLEKAGHIQKETRQNGKSKLLRLLTRVPPFSGKTNASSNGHIPQ